MQAAATEWLVTADASLVGADAPAVARVRALGAAGGPSSAACTGRRPAPLRRSSPRGEGARRRGLLRAHPRVAGPRPRARRRRRRRAPRRARRRRRRAARGRARGVWRARRDVVAEGGGAGAFARAYAAAADERADDAAAAAFGAHHVLLNPVLAAVPAGFLARLERAGGDCKVLVADGWGPADTPFSCANCATFFEFCESAPDRAEALVLVPPKGPTSITTPGLKPMRAADYMCGEAVPDRARSARKATPTKSSC